MQADAQCRCAQSKNRRGLPWREALPSDQKQEFPIPLAEASESRSQRRLEPVALRGRRNFFNPVEPLVQSGPSSLASAMRAKDATRDAEQPRQRIFRHVLKSPQANEEHLGHEIVLIPDPTTPQDVMTGPRSSVHLL